MEYSCRTTLEERTQTQSNRTQMGCDPGAGAEARLRLSEEAPELGELAVSTSGTGRGLSPFSSVWVWLWGWARPGLSCSRLQAFCCLNPARQHRPGWRFSHQWRNPTTARLRLSRRHTRPPRDFFLILNLINNQYLFRFQEFKTHKSIHVWHSHPKGSSLRQITCSKSSQFFCKEKCLTSFKMYY